jgi:hypothetical protein
MYKDTPWTLLQYPMALDYQRDPIHHGRDYLRETLRWLAAPHQSVILTMYLDPKAFV